MLTPNRHSWSRLSRLFGEYRSQSLRSGPPTPKQYGALPYRIDENGLKILLVTSRASGQWIVPKGWPCLGMSPYLSAAKEAYEEAGIVGQPCKHSIGVFHHTKSNGGIRVMIEIYPLLVTCELENWPEKGQRQRRWLTPSEAGSAITNPMLRTLILSFDPKRLANPN